MASARQDLCPTDLCPAIVPTAPTRRAILRGSMTAPAPTPTNRTPSGLPTDSVALPLGVCHLRRTDRTPSGWPTVSGGFPLRVRPSRRPPGGKRMATGLLALLTLVAAGGCHSGGQRGATNGPGTSLAPSRGAAAGGAGAGGGGAASGGQPG